MAVLCLARPALVSAEETVEPVCPPFPSQPPPSLDSFYEPGLRGSDVGAVLAAEQGSVVPLAPAPAPDGVPAVPGEALLALPKNARGSVPKDFELVAGARVADSFWSSVLCAAVLRVVGPTDRTPEQLVPRVPETAVAAPNHVYRTAGVAVRPLAVREGPDPYRALQWGHDRLGVAASRVRGDGAGARVAVLDSAPEVQHPELAGVRVRALPGGPEPAPAAHGTLVTGVVRALEDNGFGIAGVAPGAELVAIPICVPGAQGAADACRLYDTLRGIEAAWEEKARVVNLAFVGPPNPLLERAVERLEDLGVLVVAAAGNEATREPRYPAAYPSVIGVGAIDREGRAYEHGNLGASAELEAPGVEILSTHPGASFAFADGTSMAAAHVSGTLAILLGAGLSPLEARVAVLALGGRSSRRGVVALAPVCELLKRGDRSC